MAVTSTLILVPGLSGDRQLTERLYMTPNGASPGMIQNIRLAAGANTITLPYISVTPITPVVAIITPPVGNVLALTLKGVTGDTGIALHKTNPFVLSFDAALASTFVLTAEAAMTVTIYWL